jgi:hypothetical protein
MGNASLASAVLMPALAPAVATVESARNQRKEFEKVQKEMSDRRAGLLKKQQAAQAEADRNEKLTRERTQAQAAKRLAIGLAQGKTGTTKTSALGLQNSGNLANNRLGVA